MSDLAVSLLILIAFATGLSTGYYCGHAKGRIATLADLQRVSESLADGMSAGPAQATNDVPLTQKQLDELFEISPRDPASDISTRG